MQPSTTTHSDVAHPSLLTRTVGLFEKWSKPSPRSRAMALTPSIDCVQDTPWVQMGVQRSLLLLAGEVLRLAREHNRLRSSLVKPRGNGGSDVTAMTCLSKRVTYSRNGFLRGIAVVKNIASLSVSLSAADDRDRGRKIA
jgi:hypothetical protein